MPKTILAVAAALSLTCACSTTRTITTKDGTISVDSSKGKDEGAVHIAGKDGASVDINTGKPITDYPADAPLYEGKAIMDMKTSQKDGRVVTLQTPDSLDKISDFYKSQLASKGWKTEGTVSSPQMVMYSATKEKRKLVVTIGTDGKMQTISQQLAEQ